MKTKLKFISIIITALILNIIWEYLHFPLYIDLTGIPKHLHLWIAIFADTTWITLMLTIVSLKNKTINWIKKPKALDYTIIVILGIIIASSIELYSVGNARWEYLPAMPTIFSISLSPLLQLFTTTILSLEIWKRIRNSNN